MNGTKLFKHHTSKSLQAVLSESFESQQTNKRRNNQNQMPNIFHKLYKYKLHKGQMSIEEEKSLLDKIKSMESIAKCNRTEILYILNTEIINNKTVENKRKINNFFFANEMNGNQLKSISKQQFLTQLKKKYKFKFVKPYENLISFSYGTNQQSIQDAKQEKEIRTLTSIVNCDEEQILFVLNNVIKSANNTSLNKNANSIINNVFKKYKMTG
eukprot:407087_1